MSNLIDNKSLPWNWNKLYDFATPHRFSLRKYLEFTLEIQEAIEKNPS